MRPVGRLEQLGFEATYIEPTESGWARAQDTTNAVNEVSVMRVNNEAGMTQPLATIADELTGHPAYFHTDASQGFGKELQELVPRIDLSASGHKLYAPKGMGR